MHFVHNISGKVREVSFENSSIFYAVSPTKSTVRPMILPLVSNFRFIFSYAPVFMLIEEDGIFLADQVFYPN